MVLVISKKNTKLKIQSNILNYKNIGTHGRFYRFITHCYGGALYATPNLEIHYTPNKLSEHESKPLLLRFKLKINFWLVSWKWEIKGIISKLDFKILQLSENLLIIRQNISLSRTPSRVSALYYGFSMVFILDGYSIHVAM